MTMIVKDEWVRAAITDDRVVAELLLRLKQAQAATSASKSALPVLKWGIRQPRSRPMSLRCYDAKRDVDFNVSARGSPTTPLSWSGGSGSASPSAADGFEETSRRVLRSPPLAPSRSKPAVPTETLAKGTASNEITRTTAKKSRRKRTFAELKEEENLLLKERVYLKKEIASTRATFTEQKATNENLKRIRLDLNSHAAKNSSLITDEPMKLPSCQPRPRVPYSLDFIASTLPSPQALDDHKPLLDSCNVDKANSSKESFFLLPDLNMMPAEDDSGAETLYGTS